jgi:hypothetical protein
VNTQHRAPLIWVLSQQGFNVTVTGTICMPAAGEYTLATSSNGF